ncbi:MAG: sensor histidine kinase [Spirochaetaceae bacterium]
MVFLFSTIYKNKIEKRFINEQNTVLNTVYHDVIERHISDMEALTIAISKNRELHNVFQDQDAYNRIQGQWDLCIEIFPERSWIYYGTEDNELIVSPIWEKPAGYEIKNRPWYITGKNSETIKWTDPYHEYTSNDLVVSATIGIKDYNNKFTGVLSIDTTAQDFLKLLKIEALGKSTELIVVSSEGIPVSLNNEFSKNSSNFDWESFLKKPQKENTININNTKYYYRTIYIDELQMFIVSLLPNSIIEDETKQMQFIIHLLLTIGLISALIAGSYTSRYIIKNILSANKYINDIAGGKYNKISIATNNDEFMTLNTNLNTLVDKISGQIKELKDVNNKLDKTLHKKEELVELRTSLIHLLSHNSASPLTFLYNITLELLQGDNDKTEYKMIHGAARNLKSLNENIMTFLKLDEGIHSTNREEVDLPELTNILIRNFAYQYREKHITIDVIHSKNTVVVNSYFLIKMILENLIDNSIKYSYEKSFININISEKNSWAIWEIQDGGPGFSVDDKKLLFGKFQRLSAKPTGGEGSIGLGLYLVKQLSENIGANVSLDDAPNTTGAKFILKFRL